MIKKISVFILVIVTSISYAQEGTSSPYSFYGVGLQKFKGTVENRSMGGLSMVTDSIHINLQNPAAFGELRLTNYTLGTTYNGLNLDNNAGEDSYKDNVSLDYLAIGIPAGKFGVGFGMIPINSVGYKTNKFNSDGSETQFFGSGGLNKVFISAGYKANDNLSIGLELNYNFGSIQNKAILKRSGTQFDTREINESNLSGIGMSLGLTYKTLVTDKLQLTTSLVSTPSFKLISENNLQLATVIALDRGEQVIDSQNIEVADKKVNLPAELKLGVGIGEQKKWFLGAEYTYLDSDKFENRSSTIDEVTYKKASKYRLGGYYIPKYNSLTSFLSRVVYRGGIRFEETGLHINKESINEFGISFGVGLPVGRLFSNANIGFEFGTRGTLNAGLVKEEFFNLSVSLSLNDKWFRKVKFN